MLISSERTTKLFWFIVLAGLSGVLGWIAFDRPGSPGHVTRGEPASAMLAGETSQDDLNFCRLPLSEVSKRPADPPDLKDAFNSLFERTRSMLIDLEYLSSLASTVKTAKELRSDLTDLNVSTTTDVLSPARWSIVVIYLTETKPNRSPNMTEQELWQSYHLITERYEAKLIEYDKIRDKVFASINIDAPDTTTLRSSPLPGGREWP